MKFKGQMQNTLMSIVFFAVLLVVGVLVFVSVYEGVPGIDQTFVGEAIGSFSNSSALQSYTLLNIPVLSGSFVLSNNASSLISLTENTTGAPQSGNATLAQYRLDLTTGVFDLNYSNSTIAGTMVLTANYEQQNAQADARTTYTNLRSVTLDAMNLAVVAGLVLAAVMIIGFLYLFKR